MDKNLFFVLKFKHIFEKKVTVFCYFYRAPLCSGNRTRRFLPRMLHYVYLPQEIRIKKTMLENKTGFKKYISINIKLHSVESYSPIILNRIADNNIPVTECSLILKWYTPYSDPFLLRFSLGSFVVVI